MSLNYIIEVRPRPFGKTVPAGIVIRDGNKFRFFSATHEFDRLEGQLFRNPKEAEKARVAPNQRYAVERQPFAVRLQLVEQRRRQIAFGERGKNHDDILSGHARPLSEFDGGRHCRAG